MKSATDRLGYSLYIICLVLMLSKYAPFVLYNIIHKTCGNEVVVKILNKEQVGKVYIYTAKVDGEIYKSIKTPNTYDSGSTVNVKTVPILKRFFFGEVSTSLLLFSLTVIIFLTAIAIFCLTELLELGLRHPRKH